MTDLELRRLVQELAGLRSDTEPVVTLYLDTHWQDEKQRERARVLVREAAKAELDKHAAHPQRDALRRTLDRIVDEAAGRATEAGGRPGHGLAIFACEAVGLWRVVELAQRFDTKLCTGPRPKLLPLARLLEGAEAAYVAVVHQRGARLYEVALGDVVNEATIEGPLPRTAASGGHQPRPSHGRQIMSGERTMGEGFQYERAQKNQRHKEKAVERNHAAAAGFLVQRFDLRPASLVLVGPKAVVAAFERTLPERARSRVVARQAEPNGAPASSPAARDRLVHAAIEAVREADRAEEREILESAIGQALRGGLAVLGPEEVVLAVNERRVHRLILEDDFARAGWACRNCDAIGVSHAETCTFCGGALAWVQEMGEEIASRVLADDGEVDVVPHDRRLHAYHGVAATLRQTTASRGLGASERSAPLS